jgi:signal transduction histidine kinase
MKPNRKPANLDGRTCNPPLGRIWWLVFLVGFSSHRISLGQGAALEVGRLEPDRQYTLLPYCEIWADPSGQATLAEVLDQGTQASFGPLRLREVDIAAQHYWVRCRVHNPHPDPVRLSFYFRALEQVQVYLLPGAGPPPHPLPPPVSERKYKRYKDLEYLAIPPGASVLYLHIRGEQSIYQAYIREGLGSLSFFEANYQNFWVKNKQSLYVFGLLFLGALGLMLVYNTILYFILWEKSYLYYLGYLCFVGVRVFAERDYYADWVSPDPPKYYLWLITIAPIGFTIFLLLFTQTFLELKRQLPWAHRLVGALTALVGLTLVPVVLGIYHYFLPFYLGSLVAAYLGMLGIALVMVWRKGPKTRLFYLFGNIGMIVGVLVYILVSPVNLYTVNSGLIGFLVEMSLLSLGLANKINEARQLLAEERLRQQREKQELIEAQNRELEGRVRQSNEAKDYLFSVVAHDIRAPLASTVQAIDVLGQEELLSEPERRLLVGEVSRQLQATFGFIDDLLLWAKSQMEQFVLHPQPEVAAKLVAEAMGPLQRLAQERGVGLVNQVDASLVVLADGPTVKIVLNNLLKNALGATQAGGQVLISGQAGAGWATFEVADTGQGMSPEVLARLFSPVLNNNRAGGIGLLLCKDFVQRNGGRLWAESEPGQGSRFLFTLPIWPGQ